MLMVNHPEVVAAAAPVPAPAPATAPAAAPATAPDPWGGQGSALIFNLITFAHVEKFHLSAHKGGWQNDTRVLEQHLMDLCFKCSTFTGDISSQGISHMITSFFASSKDEQKENEKADQKDDQKAADKKGEEKAAEKKKQNKNKINVLVIVGIAATSGAIWLDKKNILTPSDVLKTWKSSPAFKNGEQLLLFISSPENSLSWIESTELFLSEFPEIKNSIAIQISGNNCPLQGGFLSTWTQYAQGKMRSVPGTLSGHMPKAPSDPDKGSVERYEKAMQQYEDNKTGLFGGRRFQILSRAQVPALFNLLKSDRTPSIIPPEYCQLTVPKPKEVVLFDFAIIGSGKEGLPLDVSSSASAVQKYLSESGGVCRAYTVSDHLQQEDGREAIRKLFNSTRCTEHVLVYIGKSNIHNDGVTFNAQSSMSFDWILNEWTKSISYQQNGRLCLMIHTSNAGDWVTSAKETNRPLRMCIQASACNHEISPYFFRNFLQYLAGYTEAEPLLQLSSAPTAYAELPQESKYNDGPGVITTFLTAAHVPFIFNDKYTFMCCPEEIAELKREVQHVSALCDNMKVMAMPAGYLKTFTQTIQQIREEMGEHQKLLRSTTCPRNSCRHIMGWSYTPGLYLAKNGIPHNGNCDVCSKELNVKEGGFLHCSNCIEQGGFDMCRRCFDMMTTIRS